MSKIQKPNDLVAPDNSDHVQNVNELPSSPPPTPTPQVNTNLFSPQTLNDRLDAIYYRVRGLVLFCSVIGVLFGMNIIQLMLLIVHWLGYKKLAQQMNCFMAGIIFYAFVYILEYGSGLKLEFSGDKIPSNESAFVITNHVSALDIMLIMTLAARKAMIGNLVYMAKNSIKYFPVVGWGMNLYGMIFLSRAWDTDSEAVEKSFKNIKTIQQPMYFVSFLEGTRITPAKLEEAREFARKRNLNQPSKVLIPRVKGFKAIIKSLRNSHVKYIYDITIGYPPLDDFVRHGKRVLTVWDMFGRDLSQAKVCINIKRIKINSLPLDNDEELTNWVYERFNRKDKLLNQMYAEASQKYKKYQAERRLLQNVEFLKHQPKPKPYSFYRFPGEPIQDEPLQLQWWGNAWNLVEEHKKK